MHRIDAPGHSANTFTEGNPSTAVQATTVSADWLNAVQEEVAGFIEAQGLVLDKADNTQFKQATDLAVSNSAAPIGAELNWYSDTAPQGWLIQDGALYSISTYNNLDAHLGGKTALDAGTACTFDDTTEKVNAAGHGLANDQLIRFSNSGGALPPAITARYARFYVVNATANDFQISLTKAGAPIDIVGTGTGTHYFHIKFAVPDPRGRVIRITDGGAGVDPDAAARTDRGDGIAGDNVGTKQADELKTHVHTTNTLNANNGYTGNNGANRRNFGAENTSSTGGNETRMVNEGRLAIIKY